MSDACADRCANRSPWTQSAPAVLFASFSHPIGSEEEGSEKCRPARERSQSQAHDMVWHWLSRASAASAKGAVAPAAKRRRNPPEEKEKTFERAGRPNFCQKGLAGMASVSHE